MASNSWLEGDGVTGKSAGEVDGAASEAADSLHPIESRGLAATRLLSAGQADQARALLDEVLRELGMPLAHSRLIARARAAWQRLRVTARGFVFRQREQGAIDAAQLARLDTLRLCATGLSWLDAVASVEYHSRYTRMALDAGEPGRIAFALAMESVIIESASPQSRRANALLERAAALARRHGDPTVSASVECCRVRMLFERGEPGVLRVAERAIAALRERGMLATTEAVHARDALMHELILRGELTQAVELAHAISAEAESSADALTLVMLTKGMPHSAWLVRDGAEEAERRLLRGREAWVTAAFDRTRLESLCAEIRMAFYRDAPERAWACLERDRVALEASDVLRAPRAKIALGLARGVTAAWLARGSAQVSLDRAALLAVAERDAVALQRSAPHDLEAFQLALRAALAFARGEPDAAAMYLRAIIEHGDERPAAMFAAAARRRLGQLIGGDEGAALLAAGESALRAQSVIDPEAMTRHLLPGCHA